MFHCAQEIKRDSTLLQAITRRGAHWEDRHKPMSGKSIKTLEVRSHEEWRSWLREHHELETEIWLVFN
jgi:hypothetical protein